jgi:hypothetical protein
MRTTARIVLAGVLGTLCLTVTTLPQSTTAARSPVYCCR